MPACLESALLGRRGTAMPGHGLRCCAWPGIAGPGRHGRPLKAAALPRLALLGRPCCAVAGQAERYGAWHGLTLPALPGPACFNPPPARRPGETLYRPVPG